MKKKLIGILTSIVTCTICLQAQQEYKLWYDRPAGKWIEALPLGNGRLGAMVYGDPSNEEIQLNEETVWGGSPHNNTNTKAKDALAEIRRLIFDGKNMEATDLCGKTISSPRAKGMPYQTAGSLHLDFGNFRSYANYYRELDLDRAVTTTRFTSGDVDYVRETITSLNNDVILMRLTASKPGSISFTARYTSPMPDTKRSVTTDGLLVLEGKGSDHEGIEGKIRYATLLQCQLDGGRQKSQGDTALVVSKANSVLLCISIGTNFKNNKDISGDAMTKAKALLGKRPALNSFEQARDAHTEAYRKYFRRSMLDLGRNAQADKPTDVRIREFNTLFDPQLPALLYQFGRYLLICSSQPGGQPANLQGIWNDKERGAWDGKYTTNINVEMNYWPAGSGGRQAHPKHNRRNELLAGQNPLNPRNARAVPAADTRGGRNRQAKRLRDVRLPRLDAAPQHRHLAHHRLGRQALNRCMDHVQRLVLPASVGPLPLLGRPPVSVGSIPDNEVGMRVLLRLPGQRAQERMARGVALVLSREPAKHQLQAHIHHRGRMHNGQSDG